MEPESHELRVCETVIPHSSRRGVEAATALARTTDILEVVPSNLRRAHAFMYGYLMAGRSLHGSP